MKLKNRILNLLVLLLLSSCTEVLFVEPQPRNIENEETFPIELQGIYINKNNDTLIIENKMYSYRDYKNGELSESIILRESDGYYFLNEQKGVFWRLFLAKFDKKSIYIYAINGGDNEKIKMLKKITEVKEIVSINDSTNIESYIVNPSSIELKNMLESSLFSQREYFLKIKKGRIK
ncbi:MAG: hypothetical protein J5I47_04815 [Vicingus serpentipes]|nr:hypothetical protein [Vicingus serpentipes]